MLLVGIVSVLVIITTTTLVTMALMWVASWGTLRALTIRAHHARTSPASHVCAGANLVAVRVIKAALVWCSTTSIIIVIIGITLVLIVGLRLVHLRTLEDQCLLLRNILLV